MKNNSQDQVDSSSALRLAIDIGGTFTDSVLVDQNNAIVASTKTVSYTHLTLPTTPYV